MHGSHWQVAALHAWLPPIPQARTAPAAHTPSFPQVDQADQVPLSQVRVWVPHLPQAWVVAPEQVWPAQASHWQVALHDCTPPVPQAWVAPTMHTPSFAQVADQSDQTPLLQVRLLVPQFPQAMVAEPLQVWPVHPPHWQVAPQVWLPPVPQACVVAGAQTPWFAQPDQSDQVPLLQVRVCVPQFPHACIAGPAQVCPPHPPHWHESPQVRAPPVPHICIEPGAQAPSAEHADQLDQTPLLHVRACVPQLPHACADGPAQLCPLHVDH
jgi:hypothetical protein